MKMKNWICMILSLALLLTVGFAGTVYAEETCEEEMTEEDEKGGLLGVNIDYSELTDQICLHWYCDWQTVSPPSCDADGSRVRTCVCCGDQIFDSIPAKGHSMTESIVPATCESGGCTVHTCSACGYSYTDNETPLAGHSFGDWSIVSEPGCANEGSEVRTCTVCGAQESRSIPASSDHQMTKDTVPPTCESGGYTIHTCSVCGYSYTDNETPALGHSFGSWKMTTAPTCAAEGEQTRTCTRCGQTETQVYPATGNHYFKTSVTKANCLREGYTTYTCRICGYNYNADETPKTDHKMGSWTCSKSATCQQDGEQKRKCIYCSYTETQPITDRPDHMYQTKVVAPTCQGAGYTEHVCQVCGYSYRDAENPKTDHNFGEWYNATESTCATHGTAKRSCKTCGTVENKELPTNDKHVYIDTVVRPTCQKEGYTEHKCKNCGKAYTDAKTKKVGHNYVTSIVDSDCNHEGYTLHKCSVCGDEYRETYTPKTTHLYRCTETSATCQHAGVQTWTCFWCGDSYKVNAPVQPHSYSVSVFNEATRDSHGEAHSECQWCGEKVNSIVTHYYVPTTSVKPSGGDPGYTTFTCTICGDSYNTSKYNEKIDYGLQIAKSDKSQEEKLRDIFAASEFYLGNCVIGSGNIYNMCNACGIECKIVSIHNPEQQARFGYTEEDIAYMNQTGFYPNGIGRDHHWVVCTIDGKTYEYGL